MEEKRNKPLAGWMVLGLIVVGLFGIFAGLLSFLNEYDYVGTGLCLIASALAFGKVLESF
jgi:hypothetical protein